MNIFNYVSRSVRKVTSSNSINFYTQFVDNTGVVKNIVLCETYMPIASSPTDSICRVINGSSRSCAPSSRLSSFELIWNDDGDLVYRNPNTQQVAFKIKRSDISELGLGTEVEFMIEVGNIFQCISREGRMPAQYRGISSEQPISTEEATMRSSANMVDDIPDDVFTMATIIDRIRNCGDIANAKEVPVIIRFNDKKLMITDTSVEDGFLYLDVIEVPKKKIEKPSIKFSDYIKFIDNDITIGDGIWEQMNISPSTYGSTTVATSATLDSSGSSMGI